MSSTKSVSFNPLAEVEIIMSIHDYSDKERQACWYSIEEVHEIKRLNKHIVEIHRAATVDRSLLSILQNQDEFTERGLEHYFASSTKLQNCKRRAAHLVMQEQFFAKFNQIHYGDDDDDDDDEVDQEEMEKATFELAQHYKSVAYECKKCAYMRGVNDARAAKQVWEEQAMPMVKFALNEVTAIVEKSDQSKNCLAAPRSKFTPTNFFQKLAAFRRPAAYSLAA